MGVYPEGAGPGEAMGSRHHGGDLAVLRQEWVWGGHPSPPRKYDLVLLGSCAWGDPHPVCLLHPYILFPQPPGGSR